MSNVYNLQTKITKEAEAKYRILCDKDKRKISNFSKLILEMLVEDMIIEDESTHRLHIERLSIYNEVFAKSNSNVSAVINDMLIKEEKRKEDTSKKKEVKEINQSTTNIIPNNMFGAK